MADETEGTEQAVDTTAAVAGTDTNSVLATSENAEERIAVILNRDEIEEDKAEAAEAVDEGKEEAVADVKAAADAPPALTAAQYKLAAHLGYSREQADKFNVSGVFADVVGDGEAKPAAEDALDLEDDEDGDDEVADDDNARVQKKPPRTAVAAESDDKIPDLPEGEYDDNLLAYSKGVKAAFAKQQEKVQKIEKQNAELQKFVKEVKQERAAEAAQAMAMEIDAILLSMPDIKEFIGEGSYGDLKDPKHRALREEIIKGIGETMDSIKGKNKPMPDGKTLVKRAAYSVLGEEISKARDKAVKDKQLSDQKRKAGMTTARPTNRKSSSGVSAEKESEMDIKAILARAAARA